MAEASGIECPVTPERLDQCPSTPNRLLNIKSPDSNASSEECFQSSRTTVNSPPPNCAICLCKCKNKCFTNSCLHQFCFKCLVEWSKVKAECPLCKQGFKSIIHNVKSIDQFEEYLVSQPSTNSITFPPASISTISTLSSHAHVAHHRHQIYNPSIDIILGELPARFRNGYSATIQVHPDNETFQQLFLQQSTPSVRYHHESHENLLVNRQGLDWRRYIYDRRFYARPLSDFTGRNRDCSARFYRENPAQIHRLMPWINRDIAVLLRNDREHRATHVIDAIAALLTIYNISSPDFRRRCQPYIRQKTSHFIHELYNFARSPFDMYGYDRAVVYGPYDEVEISSSSSSDETLRQRGPRRSRTEFTIASSFSTVFVTGTIDDVSGTQVSASTSQSTTNSSSNENNAENNLVVDINDQPQVLGRHNVIQIDRNIVLSSSSNDECEFVLEQKPPHLRTPELVTLNSDDSDVIFVSECIPKISPSANSSRSNRLIQTIIMEDNKEIEKIKLNPNAEKSAKKHLGCVKDEYNNGASTSSGFCIRDRRNYTKSKKSRNLRHKCYSCPDRKSVEKKHSKKSIYEDSTTSQSESSSESSSGNSFFTDSSSSESSDTDSSWSASKRGKKRRQGSSYKKKRSTTGCSQKKKLRTRKKVQKKKRTLNQRNKKSSRFRPVTSSSESDVSSHSPCS